MKSDWVSQERRLAKISGSWSRSVARCPWRISMKLLIADCGLRIADCVLRHGSWPVRRSERNRELPMNRLVTGNCSLVIGDLEKLIPNVKPFSISSYQLPVTSYQLPVTSYQLPVTSYKSKRFMVPMRGEKQGGSP